MVYAFFTVWCEKQGFHIKKESKYTSYGKQRESAIFDETQKIIKKIYFTNTKEILKTPDTYLMKEYPFIGANLDGLIRLEDDRLIGLEIKTSSSWFGWEEMRNFLGTIGVKCNIICLLQD